MTKAFWKTIRRSITGSLGRYIAIFMIIALGVGFFTGLKSTKPAMNVTTKNYVNEYNLYDLKLLSTIGFDAEEVQKINELTEITLARGAISKDFLVQSEGNNEVVLRAHSITEDVNLLDLISGRLPETANECVVDSRVFNEDMIGKTLLISDNNLDETKESFKYQEYTVTGRVNSPMYLNVQRGTTSIGTGTLTGFVFIPLDGFEYEYFTEVYAVCENEVELFSEEYDDFLDSIADSCKDGTTDIIMDRFHDLKSDAKVQLDDAEEELEKAKAEADNKLLTAKQELDDAKSKLDDAKKELEDAKISLDEAAAKMKSNYSSWDDALQAGKKSYEEGKSSYEKEIADAKKKLQVAYDELTKSEKSYQENLKNYQDGLLKYEDGYAQYEQGKNSYDEEYANFIAGKPYLSEAEISVYETKFSESLATLTATKTTLDETKKQLDEANLQLTDGKSQLDQGWKEYHASTGILSNEEKAGKEKLEEAKKGLSDFKEGISSYQDGLSEYEKGKAEYEDGLQEYEDGVKERDDEIAEAEAEIADRRQELEDIKEPSVYVLGRNMNAGYASYVSDSQIVDGVARVFPIFFFAIAALVCSTTMTRMVDDERTQIGTFSAIGYSRRTIVAKYLIYSGSAAIGGCLVGFFVGATIFPYTIWTAYGMLYGFASLDHIYPMYLLGISMVVAILCSAGTTYAACRGGLRETPADLIRPKAPAAGKRIFLEKITFLWKRMKFIHKVSARNIFRFKKRMLMMILGISGCTALVLTGFGISDSIANIANFQFDDIMQYEIGLTLNEKIDDNFMTEFEQNFADDVKDYAILSMSSVDVTCGNEVKSVYLGVTSDTKIGDIIHFANNGERVEYPSDGEVIISKKLAEMANVSVDDKIELSVEEGKKVSLTVSGTFENYVYNYIYMTNRTYETAFQSEYEPNTIYLNTMENVDVYQVSTKLQTLDNVSAVSVIQELRNHVDDMMKSLNYVVILVIASAGALAFIVLFNLGNINISERVREIATIKVLGFHSGETGAYVFRENLVLSIMGIIVGLPLGIFLHRFVMTQIKIDMVTFKVVVAPLSFLYTVLVVLGFTIITDFIMRRKIDAIDMAESLKSIE